jgi:hypothetical protein
MLVTVGGYVLVRSWFVLESSEGRVEGVIKRVRPGGETRFWSVSVGVKYVLGDVKLVYK